MSSPSYPKVRLALFGNLYPSKTRLGPHTTGLVILLTQSRAVERLVVFANYDANLPDCFHCANVILDKSWKHDAPGTLIRTWFKMNEIRSSIDNYLFNVYPTSFGRAKISNVVGLLLPYFLSFASPGRVAVYLHNTPDTQDVKGLGFSPSPFALQLVRAVIRRLAQRTFVIVPLASQQKQLSSLYRIQTAAHHLPFVEGVPLLLQPESGSLRSRGFLSKADAGRELREIVIFGAWGPQKNVQLALAPLRKLAGAGLRFRVTVIGAVNPSFPETARELRELREGSLPFPVRLSMDPSDAELIAALESADVLLLPYNASGGASGVLNVAGLFGIPTVASDLPQLREVAKLINVNSTFVHWEDEVATSSAIGQILSRRPEGLASGFSIEAHYRESLESATNLIRLISEEEPEDK